jgi:ribosomal-protein-alanine N-acetyltransferase
MEAAVRAERGRAALEVEAPRHPSGPAAVPEPATVIARGERVYIRTLVPGDLRHLAAWADDPFLERMVGSDFLRTYRRLYDGDAAFFEAALADPTQVAFIVMTNDGRPAPVGLVRLFNIHLSEGYAFLETVIADRTCIRKGCGVEAGKLMCAYGLDVLGLQRIEAKVYEYNFLSINSLKRNGFRQEGVLRKAGFQGGAHCDVIVFGILREELEAQRRKEAHPELFHFPFVAEPRER